ncbi:MAG TPA: hypothetical protein VLL27_11565 [Solirubrobacterales bacterium]|nr:hypothetical protein [Solirubrobacterales bacterium]
MRVVLAPIASSPVDVLGPRVPVAGGVGEGGDRASQPLVAGAPEDRRPALARLQGDRAHAGVGGKRRVTRVTASGIAQLGDQRRRADRRLAVPEQRREDRRVGMGGERAADLRGQLCDLGDDRPQGCDQAQHHGPACLALALAGAAGGSKAHPLQEFLRAAPTAVLVAGEKALHPLGAEAAGVGGARVAGQEGEGDRRVDVGEDERSGPEGLELGAQLVCQLDPNPDQVLSGPGQGSQCLGLVRVGPDRPQSVGVGARQLGQDEGVEAIGLATSDRVALTRSLGLVGVHGDHGQARLEEAVHQDPVGALDRHPADAQLHQLATEGGDGRLAVGDPPLPQPLALLVDDAERVLGGGPVDPCELLHLSSSVGYLRFRAGREEPLRVLIGRRLQTPRPVGASGASNRREALVSSGPSRRLARLALSRRRLALCVPRGSSTASLRSASQSQKNKREVGQ